MNFQTGVVPIPRQRILDKLDGYMSRKDFAGAEQHLRYWMGEAERGNDQYGQLTVCNELIGFYRKTGQEAPALAAIEKALHLLAALKLGETTSVGTTCVNIATALCAFGWHAEALKHFENARLIYESDPQTPTHLLGGLYNNMALACQAVGRFSEAYDYYDRALVQMEKVSGGVLEQAITCLNIADAVAADVGMEQGEERIFSLLDKASTLLRDSSVPRDSYYAFVCEKCAPGFSYYGYFAVAEELRKEAERIYERT